ncbi:MAG: hypothetical protein Q8J78_13915, partial [Moraxellaceae bacterium]|nr:hypothetical protein [Moraxellaceae bacterium]
MTTAEFHTRGLVLDALTALKSAHEELLNGNHQRADIYLQKGWILIQEARTETAKLATRPPSRP